MCHSDRCPWTQRIEVVSVAAKHIPNSNRWHLLSQNYSDTPNTAQLVFSLLKDSSSVSPLHPHCTGSEPHWYDSFPLRHADACASFFMSLNIACAFDKLNSPNSSDCSIYSKEPQNQALVSDFVENHLQTRQHFISVLWHSGALR